MEFMVGSKPGSIPEKPRSCITEGSSEWVGITISSKNILLQLTTQFSYTDSDQPSTISIDHFGLCNPTEHSHAPCSDSDLVKHLKGIIKFRGGPISVAKYMEEVLTNPKAGFYMNRNVFHYLSGSCGDKHELELSAIVKPFPIAFDVLKIFPHIPRMVNLVVVKLSPSY